MNVKLLVLAALLLPLASVAEVNLPLVCTLPGITGTQLCGSANRVYAVPTATSSITTTDNVWLPIAQAYANGKQVWVCKADLAPGAGNKACAAADKIAVDLCDVYGLGPIESRCEEEEPPNDPPAFSKNVVKLSWSAPTQNDNGTALTDLAGFKVYSAAVNADGSAPSAAQLSLLTTIADKAAVSKQLTGYGWGKYYFSMTAYNSKLVESARSSVVFAEFKEPTTQPKEPTGVTVEVELHYP